jgi:hypothetical protein
VGDINKEAGGIIESLGLQARQTIMGVWFPGILLLCEAGYIYTLAARPRTESPFSLASSFVKGLDSEVVAGFVAFLALGVAMTLGYVARDMAFYVSDWWLAAGWRPARSVRKIIGQLRLVYGATEVDTILGRYRVFQLVENTQSMKALPRSPDSYVREFCKQWLRLNSPTQITEGFELEINLALGLIPPVAFGSIILVLLYFDLRGLVAGLLCLSLAGFMMYRANWSRSMETEIALVNFLFAHWQADQEATSGNAAASDSGRVPSGH